MTNATILNTGDNIFYTEIAMHNISFIKESRGPQPLSKY
jgi:hypothetical protein